MPKTPKSKLEYIQAWRTSNREKVLRHKRTYYLIHQAEIAAANAERNRRHREAKTVVYAREMLVHHSGGVIKAADLPPGLAEAYAEYLKLRVKLGKNKGR